MTQETGISIYFEIKCVPKPNQGNVDLVRLDKVKGCKPFYVPA